MILNGVLKDMKVIMKKYPRPELIEVLKKCRELDAVTHNFCSHYFNIPKAEMYAPAEYY